MQRIKVLVAFGTRPEAVKLAPVCQALLALRDQVETVVCDTGQHSEMVQHILSFFKIVPDIRLGIMKPNQTLFHVTSAVLHAFEEVLAQQRPDAVIVQGDTTTAMTVALAGYYANCKVAHVEAGLRTNAKRSPFPEEINRRLIGQLADFHFAPTPAAKANLLAEGINPATVWDTGNTVVDALEFFRKVMQDRSGGMTEQKAVPHVKAGEMVLITCHRRESFGEPMRDICTAIRQLATENPTLQFVYPVHLNPNVQQVVRAELAAMPNIHLLEPQPYDRFLELMSRAKLILTDSGGIQEEAYTFRKPLLVLRNHTERMEAVHAGYAWLVGSDPGRIVGQARKLLADLAAGQDFFTQANPFGDGRASERIALVLVSALAK